jgi:hypothetical protein
MALLGEHLMSDACVEAGVELLLRGDGAAHGFLHAGGQEVEPVVMFHHLVVDEPCVELAFVDEALHEMLVWSWRVCLNVVRGCDERANVCPGHYHF